MKDNKSINQSRRNILKGLVATTATTGAVIAGASASVMASESVDLPKESKKTGYRETQHIRDYYETL